MYQTPQTELAYAMSRLVVAGGNGFIGTEICRIAVQNGHHVAAFGRTGRPPLTPARHPWTGEVEWHAADIFDPDTWRDLLIDADAFVHSIGILRERLEENRTYERVNGQSAVLAAREATDADVDSFVYLSGQDAPPFIPRPFIEAKRRAEKRLSASFPHLRTVALRPNLVYGAGRWGSATLAAVLRHTPAAAVGGYATSAGRPLPVQLVAATAVHAAVTATLKGPLRPNQIADIGRTSGLVRSDEVSEPSLTPLLLGVGSATLLGWLVRRWRESA